MAGYRVLIKASAAREVDAIDSRKERQRIVERIAMLARDPRPPGNEKLAGHDDRFRVRQGVYRIVYSVDDRKRTILIVKVGHRREVYRYDEAAPGAHVTSPPPRRRPKASLRAQVS